ncbi:MAG: ribosome biogenesis GTPase Der [Tenacibaculum sp.]
MNTIIAIVGRPNVGKSTLFNRLVQRREAIVDSISGVTRDRHYGKSEWCGKEFSVIDTGGYVIGSEDVFEKEIRKQVQLAIEQADIILFVVDVEQGITPMDEAVAQLLRQVNKLVFTVVNKVDNAMRHAEAVEFYNLGFADYYAISSINGSGTGELLDAVAEKIPNPADESENKDALPRFAVVGRPNAGKSSFVNALIGEQRNIVTDIAGTTRDSIDSHYNRFGLEFNLVDTAGIRKKSKVKEDLEFYSVMRAVRAIEYCDVALVLVDAQRGFEGQDEKIFWLAEKNKKGVVILVNKWDLIEKQTNTLQNFENLIRKKIAPFTDVPIVFISAVTKQRVFKAMQTAVEVYHNKRSRITTNQLNQTLLEIIKHNPPPATKGKFIKIKYCTQLPTQTPQFAFFANLPQYIKDPYKRFIENKLRKHYNFTGVPISIYFRKK